MKSRVLFLIAFAALAFLNWEVSQHAFFTGSPQYSNIVITLSENYVPIPSRTEHCGEKSLFVVQRADGKDHRYAEVTSAFSNLGVDGQSSMLDIKIISKQFGFEAVVAQVDFSFLEQWIAAPNQYAILHCKNRHFVPALSSTAEGIVICDLSIGAEIVMQDELSGGRYFWNGNAVLLSSQDSK